MENFVIPSSTQSNAKVVSTTLSTIDFDFFSAEPPVTHKVNKLAIEKTIVGKISLPKVILDLFNDLPDLNFLKENKLNDADINRMI